MRVHVYQLLSATYAVAFALAQPAFAADLQSAFQDKGSVDQPAADGAASEPEFGPPSENGPALHETQPEIENVVDRLKENLTPELWTNFDLFLFVSKAESGPWAQHMYVLAKTEDDDVVEKFRWPVSTGRGALETSADGEHVSTDTPPGYYELDPSRFYREYTSSQWKTRMPDAMFFDRRENGKKTGLAVHAATGDEIDQLGQRASAGCVRLSPENASLLFSLIQDRYRGPMPGLASDRTGTTSKDGTLERDAKGDLIYSEGFKVLVFVDSYGGDQNAVATLY